ncbi:MAG: ATP-binding protein [Planctomycetota bacterium]|nr:ATP-binding protein [Planctomycetota bacterium]
MRRSCFVGIPNMSPYEGSNTQAQLGKARKRTPSFRRRLTLAMLTVGAANLLLVGAIQLLLDGLHLTAEVRAGILLAFFFVSAFLTYVFARRVQEQFSELLVDVVHMANAISARKDYSIRALRRGDEDFDILVDTFNHMLAQIEQHENQLREEVRRAESGTLAKSQFLAAMSHEIRTPINGILGMTQLLLDTDLDEDQDEFSQAISRSTEGLLAIINDILDFSKGEAGRIELENIPFILSKVVDGCLETVSIVAAEKGLELCCEIGDDVTENLRGDPTRLRQVLLNLLGNALKFTSEGEVVLRVVVEEDDIDQVSLRMEVEDSGIGIPKERLSRLFQPFTQIDAANNRQYGGTGLGLAISRQIVEVMGGKMFVDSEEGVGSTFGFRVNMAKEVEADTTAGPEAPRGLRILIAEPNQTSRNILERTLLSGNDVIAVNSVRGFRAELQRSDKDETGFDLLLVDHSFFHDLNNKFKKSVTALADMPVIVLAPVTRMRDVGNNTWKGRMATLMKPIHRHGLFWCIDQLLREEADPSARPADRLELLKETSKAPLPPVIHVLVAEDNVVNQRITTKFLEKLGAVWEVAENGEQAVDAVGRKKFDLVLMDIQMPVKDGLEATREIRAAEEEIGGHVRIVAVTASVLEEDRRLYEKTGFDDHLPKPLRFEELKEYVERHYGREPTQASR